MDTAAVEAGIYFPAEMPQFVAGWRLGVPNALPVLLGHIFRKQPFSFAGRNESACPQLQDEIDLRDDLARGFAAL